MGNIEPLFVGILRFSLIAFVLLGVCLLVVRLMKQPLERIRVVQICLFTLSITLALVVAGVPTIDLALLPVAKSGVPIPPADFANVETKVLPVEDEPDHSPIENNTSVATEVNDEAFAPSELSSTSTGSMTVEPSSGVTIVSLLQRTIVLAFIAVSFFNLVYLGIGFIAMRRLVRRSTELSDAALVRIQRIAGDFPTQRKLKIVSSNSIDVPMVVGVVYPTILLPKRLTRPDADPLEVEHSLAHEWGHVEMNDLATWQLACLCQTFLWVQPCYWILRRELRVAQDQLADQFAIEQTHDNTSYATTLLELSRARQTLLPGALTMAGGKSNLYRRIEMLMNEKLRMVRATRISILLSFSILFVTTGGLLTSLQLTHADSPATTTQDDGEKEAIAISDENQESAEHSGVVVDADTGKPIAGVTVTVTRMESRDWQELAVTESVTDKNGKYTFTIPPEQLSQRLLYIMFDIDHPEYAQRHCGSYGYGMIVKNLENGEQPWFSELKMVRGKKIVGRLVDNNRNPVAGAQIRANCSPKSGFDRVRSAGLEGISDKDGRFEIVATHDGTAQISFIPLDHCMKHIDVGEKRGDIGDITLNDGFPINGVVKDAEGKPMSGLWVNITPKKETSGASYEMKRSAKTDREGKFMSRPLKPGMHQFEVQTKATGALQKLKYANFHNTAPTAMFVNRSFNVTEDSSGKPLVIQAVPHVLITAQHYTPKGEISTGHSPSISGSFDGQRMWIRKGRRTGKGAYELMAPHGLEDAELRFVTNEHSGLMVQLEGGKLSTMNTFRFDRLEEDIDNVRVVRHPAGILKLDIVDESGEPIKDAGIFAHYKIEEKPSEKMMMTAQIGWNREGSIFRLSSIVPDAPVTIRFSASGFQTQTKTFTMDEGERRTVTIELNKGEDEKPADNK